MTRSLWWPFFLHLSLSILIQGCSTVNTTKRSSVRDFGVAVDVGQKATSSLDISRTSSAGPVITENNDVINVEQKQQDVVALILGPGGNRTAGHVGFIKALEEHKLKVHIVTGTGLGAVVAALYASGKRSDRIEWFFYKLFNKTKNFTPYSQNWLEVTQIMLREEFGSKRIEELPTATIIPLYDLKERRIHYFSRGPVVELLSENLKLSNNRESRFISSLQWEIHSIKFLKSYGADKLLGVSVLGREVLFQKWDDYLLGVFGKAIAMSRTSAELLDWSIELPTDTLPIDSVKEIPLFIQKSYDMAYKKVELYIKEGAKKSQGPE
ncbi:MAG: patatin-like phospholipase family protein [Bacteriovoracaceae bacterium]|nr:patatin-like phospholipase family protein [Bacteriovoracaceae bacterium]